MTNSHVINIMLVTDEKSDIFLSHVINKMIITYNMIGMKKGDDVTMINLVKWSVIKKGSLIYY